jgi:hypothetical protein
MTFLRECSFAPGRKKRKRFANNNFVENKKRE